MYDFIWWYNNGHYRRGRPNRGWFYIIRTFTFMLVGVVVELAVLFHCSWEQLPSCITRARQQSR